MLDEFNFNLSAICVTDYPIKKSDTALKLKHGVQCIPASPWRTLESNVISSDDVNWILTGIQLI